MEVSSPNNFRVVRTLRQASLTGGALQEKSASPDQIRLGRQGGNRQNPFGLFLPVPEGPPLPGNDRSKSPSILWSIILPKEGGKRCVWISTRGVINDRRDFRPQFRSVHHPDRLPFL